MIFREVISDMDKIKWGIVGTGGIAHRFAEAVKNVSDAQLVAVASRKQETADAFGNEIGILNRFPTYEAMAQSGCIDAVYIGIPHGCHAAAAKLFLKCGIAALCEKPITVNVPELESLIACAKENKTFLMEAMWGRLTPGTEKLIEIVQLGRLGEIMGVQASFCYDMSDEPDHHAFKPEYGGGSLLDVGVYGLNFSSWYFDSPVKSVTAKANLGSTGVDVHCCVLMEYDNGAIADLSSAMLLRKPNEGFVFGTKGYAYVQRYYAPQKIVLRFEGSPEEIIETPYIGNGFEEQIYHVNDCLKKGLTESPVIPFAQSLFITRQMDLVRRQIGVVYPQD